MQFKKRDDPRPSIRALNSKTKIQWPRLRSFLALFCLTILFTSAGCSFFPPVVIESEYKPGEEFKLEWEAQEEEQLWLQIRTTKGRELFAPVKVIADGKVIASGRFSLQQGRVEGGPFKFVIGWVSTPSGARGQARLFSLSEVTPGSQMVATIELQPGSGVQVKEAALKLRRGGFPWLRNLIIASVVLFAGFAVFFLVRKIRKRDRDQAPT